MNEMGKAWISKKGKANITLELEKRGLSPGSSFFSLRIKVYVTSRVFCAFNKITQIKKHFN